ncbi:MAG: Diaminopimelate decarboxylase [Firmicutes bacterium]|nr:Diaminopimelate decarboxylase [Bacillota bacterium]
MRLNDRGHLVIGGCDSVALALEHQTPLIVYDEELIRENCRRYRQSFAQGKHRVAYAGKAFLCLALCRLLNEEGLYLDVVSGGELHTALAAAFPPERIYFHGNNKSPAEIKMALDAGVGCLVVDNLYEYSLLKAMAKDYKRKVPLLLRVALGVDAATHHYIRTGQHDSKFGFSLGGSELDQVVADALPDETLELLGFHSHIGSQITNLEAFRQNVEIIYSLARHYGEKHSWQVQEINLGGGLGVPYLPEDEAQSIEDFAGYIIRVAAEQRAVDGFLPRLTIEPGRSIIAAAGTTLYTVGSIKNVPTVRDYVAVDGGMTDNPRTALYQAKYSCLLANRATEAATKLYTIAGKSCESGDILIWDHALPAVKSGDLLAVLVTGAYNYSMASNYNHLPRPAVVMVSGGLARVIIARESYADLVRLDRL